MKGIKSAVGQSFKFAPEEAGFEAAGQAVKALKRNQPNLLIVFASSRLSHKDVLKGIRTFSKVPVFGCSTAGEITQNGPAEKTVVVMALSAPALEFQMSFRKIENDSKKAAAELAEEIKKKHKKPLKGIVVFPDVFCGNGEEIMRGIEDVLGSDLPVIGGSPASEEFKKTYQYVGDEVFENGIAGLGIAGQAAVGTAARHGWKPVGISRKVTRSENRILYKLEDRPAFSIYADYFQKTAEEVFKQSFSKIGVRYPLGVKSETAEDGYEENLIRYPVKFLKESGALELSAPIEEGKEVTIMVGGKDEAVSEARAAAKNVFKDLGRREPNCVLMFSSIARRKLYGAEAKDEIDAVLNELGGIHTPMAGFYSYGEEISRKKNFFEDTDKNRKFQNCQFYNESIAILGLFSGSKK